MALNRCSWTGLRAGWPAVAVLGVGQPAWASPITPGFDVFTSNDAF